MNNYNFTGRLGRDCEVRFTQGGMAICSFSVAVAYGFGDKKGTNWLKCNIFGKRAEGGLPKYLVKGALVAISGELRIGEYVDKDQYKQKSIDVSVDKIDLLGGQNNQEHEPSQNDRGSNHQSRQHPQQDEHQPKSHPDTFASQPAFNEAPVDDDIPF